uniref:SCY1like protein 2like [Bombyx mori] n=1 Tax=Lepeophtheirus salmonis TaxID=72036 RepID=A0A0K2T2K1_LEPSM
MDVFNKFKSTFSNSVSNTVFSAASSLSVAANTISNVLPGNPVAREFEVSEHIASAGPNLCWKVYSGSKKSTKQIASIFVFEKRQLDRYDKQDKENILDITRKGIAQLTRLRHPQILTVQHPLEESRDCLAFATEPVFCSLANALGQWDNMPQDTRNRAKEYKMFDVEIKYGLLQLCEGIDFLHESVKLLHRNICPESVIINHQGAWKIFGFDYCLLNSAPVGTPPSWDFPEYDHGLISECYPDLDFLAPEYALAGTCSPASDMYSLGMIAFSLYNSKPLFANDRNWGLYKKNSCELKRLRESNLQLIPTDLKEYIKMFLNVTPELRPDAAQFSKIPFFDDVGVKTLNNLDSQFQWDNLQKSQFYKGLPQVIPRLPKRVALHRVVPCLAKEFVNPHMIPFVLPSVLMIAEEANNNDFVQYILPDLKPVMKIVEPIQILLIFMQRMEMLLSKTPPTDVKSDVLPMIYRALESDTSQIQELCLSIIPGFAGLLDYQAMKNALLPRLKKLCIHTNYLSVRVNCLICIGKLLKHFDKWLVIDEILPMLQQISSREPAVVMGIIGIVKLSMDEEKLGLTKEVIASKLLPFLFPLSIENGLTVAQYDTIINLIRELIAKVEIEHRAKLTQLNSIKDEQKSALQISMSDNMLNKSGELIPSSAVASASKDDDLFLNMGLGQYTQQKDTRELATNLMSPSSSSREPGDGLASSKSNSLSLEEKQRILREAESQKQQSASQPKTQTLGSMSSFNKKSTTNAFINSNLSQMSLNSNTPSQSSMSAQFSQSFNQPMQSQTSKPDLSAFDSLFPSRPTPSTMNSMAVSGSSQNSTFMSPVSSSSSSNFAGLNPTNVFSPSNQSQKPVKSLTASDINDLLS